MATKQQIRARVATDSYSDVSYTRDLWFDGGLQVTIWLLGLCWRARVFLVSRDSIANVC